ncbi:hypothetical protein [Lactobacillus brevis] [Lactiplantibacillus mudanjiangensis]|nr:hypothetical protein [Lactobacillus brevis] [Lactiplantibacillus mudanjiangensis]
MAKKKDHEKRCLHDIFIDFSEKHDVLIPVLIATVTSLVCLWLSKQ